MTTPVEHRVGIKIRIVPSPPRVLPQNMKNAGTLDLDTRVDFKEFEGWGLVLTDRARVGPSQRRDLPKQPKPSLTRVYGKSAVPGSSGSPNVFLEC